MYAPYILHILCLLFVYSIYILCTLCILMWGGWASNALWPPVASVASHALPLPLWPPMASVACTLNIFSLSIYIERLYECSIHTTYTLYTLILFVYSRYSMYSMYTHVGWVGISLSIYILYVYKYILYSYSMYTHVGWVGVSIYTLCILYVYSCGGWASHALWPPMASVAAHALQWPPMTSMASHDGLCGLPWPLWHLIFIYSIYSLSIYIYI